MKLGATVLMPALSPHALARMRSITETGKTPAPPTVETATAQGGRATGGMAKARHRTHEIIGRGSPLPGGEMPFVGVQGETYLAGTGDIPKQLSSESGRAAWLESRRKAVADWRTNLIRKRLQEAGNVVPPEHVKGLEQALAEQYPKGTATSSPRTFGSQPGALTTEQFRLIQAPEEEWARHMLSKQKMPAPIGPVAETGTQVTRASTPSLMRPMEEAGVGLAQQAGRRAGAEALGLGKATSVMEEGLLKQLLNVGKKVRI
jgi:hypothetical protein